MAGRVVTVAFEGVEARRVDVEVQLTGGAVHFAVVGLADKAVAESKERVRAAFAGLGLDVVEMDEKSLRESAALKLPLASSQIDIQLNAFGAAVGRPWRKEQKAACLAAWVAAAGLGKDPPASRETPDKPEERNDERRPERR